MAGLGPGRRFAALLFRSVVMLVIVFALAGIQWVWISDKLTVIYLLDQSDSIARAKRDVMLEYAIKLAQASFPEDSANRVVIITDGTETAQPNNRQSHRQVVADRTK